MKRKDRKYWFWIVGTTLLLSLIQTAMAEPSANLRFDIVGIRLVADPPALTVPKDIPTFVNTNLTLPEGAGSEAHVAVDRFANGAAVVAELRGPELLPTTVSTLPGEPLHLPPFHVVGDYFLDNIRLVKDEQTILMGSPSIVPIKVVSDILVSKVTTRELSLEEIHEKGIVIDESNFRALEFQVAFVIDGLPVDIDFPVILPSRNPANLPSKDLKEFALAKNDVFSTTPLTVVELPPELDRPGFNIHLVGAEFVPVSDQDANKQRLVPPIPALIIIPGNIGYLNQFFSAIVMVQNDAPDGSNLVVRNVTGTIKLPSGRDGVNGTFDQPGDDPLRLARTDIGIQEIVGIVQAGVDGEIGTGDDLDFLRPQDSGNGEFLIEGLREGTHEIDIELSAELHGLPSGPVDLMSVAKGIVKVSNPTFSLTFSHPQTVRTGETYEIFATVTNASDRTVNLVSVNLDPRAVSGAELLTESTVEFDHIDSGQSATARFELLSQQTGAVTFSQVTTAPGLSANFTLHTGVDERGVPLSPSALVLPKQVDQLPAALVFASQRVLGQAFSVATAPRLPEGVRFIPRSTVIQRGQELAESGMRQLFNEPIERSLYDLILDWLGNSHSNPGFEQLLRTTGAGREWATAVGAVLAPISSPLHHQREFAEVVVYRAPHLSVSSSGGLAVRITDPFDQQIGRDFTLDSFAKTLPFSQHFPFGSQGEMAVVGKVNSSVYTFEGFGTQGGTSEFGIVFPSGDGEVTQVTYEDLLIVAGSHFRVTIDTQNPGTLELQVDANGDGVFESVRSPTETLVIRDGPPQAIAARIPVEANFYARYGVLVDVLFSEKVDQESAETNGNYAIENNSIEDVVLQPTGRVATLFLSKPIGGLLPRDLSVQGIMDDQGNVLGNTSVSINDLPTDEGSLVGQVRRADGSPVAEAFVRLFEFVNDMPKPSFQLISVIRTDDQGYYDFDFIRRLETPAINVRATDPANADEANVVTRIRFEGQKLVANPTFFGRGRIVGKVELPDGTSAGAAAVNYFPDFMRTGEPGKGVFATSDGKFVIEDAVVGNFTLEVEQVNFQPSLFGEPEAIATGKFATVTGTLREAGETVEMTVVLTTRLDPSRGGIRGRVLRGNNEPGVNFPVFLGSVDDLDPRKVEIFARAQTNTDEDGNFEFADQPVGGTEVIAVDPATQQFATADVTIFADQLVGANVIFGSTGAVTGIVRDASGNLVEGAVVSGGYELVQTDAFGRFTIPEIPIGKQTIAAGSESLQRTGSTPIDVFPGQTTEVEVRLQAAANITGRVLDTSGNPVEGALVKIPIIGAGYYKSSTDADGYYIFPNMTLGKYIISAKGFNEVAPLSPGEVAAKLTADMGNALQSGSMAAVKAAYKQAVEVFVGTSNLLIEEAPDVLPGGFGFTEIQSFQDGVAAVAPDIRYIPAGQIGGITIDSNALPTRAEVEVTGLTLDEIGLPKVGRLAKVESDPVTGEFSIGIIPHGDYYLTAMTPFSPATADHKGVLNIDNPKDEDVILQFPPATETNGTFSGTVFLPDGVVPAGEGVEVQATFGDLTVTTNAEGRFVSPTPIPHNAYWLTATDPVSTLTGRAYVEIPPGGNIDTPIRLLGRTSVVVRVERPDGTTVADAEIKVENNDFPDDKANGKSDAEGEVRFTNLNEGSYSIFAIEGDSLAGRSGFTIEQEDVLMNREVGATVVLRGFGTITGTFLETDGVTPIADAQINLWVDGVAVGPTRVHGSTMTTTDEDGRFIYEKVPVGDFTILAENPRNLRVGKVHGELVDQNETVDIPILTGALGAITGHVLAADGLAPIPGARLSLSPTFLPVSSDGFPVITADANGQFSYGGVPAGPFKLTAVDPVSGFIGSVVGEVTGESEIADTEIRIEAFGTIRGNVLEADGSPASNVEVTLMSLERNFTRSTAVDGDGRFEFGNLRLEKYRLQAQKSNPSEILNGGLFETELLEHEQVIENIQIQLQGVGSVAITVNDANGVPVPSADIRLSGQTVFGGDFNVFSKADGTATIPGVPVGEFDMSVQSSTLRVGGVASGEIRDDRETVAIVVTLSEAGSIQGRLVLPDINATPVPGAFVTLHFSSQTDFGSTLQVITGGLGEFLFDNIPVGPFTIDISEPLSGGLRTLLGTVDFNEQVVDFGNVVLDLDAPFVTVTHPTEGALDIPVDQVIDITFNEAIDFSSVMFDNSGSANSIGGNLLLTAGNGMKLKADVTISADNQTLSIIPREPFESGTRYDLVVRNGTDAIRDAAAGRPVHTPFLLSFTAIDSVPPELDSQAPEPDASGVSRDAVVRLTFNEAMDFDFNLRLTKDGQPVDGNASLLFGNTVAVFTPTQLLESNATYEYHLSNAKDLAGNPLNGGDVTAQFSTIDTQGPTISGLSLVESPPHIGGSVVTLIPNSAESDIDRINYAINDVPTLTVNTSPFTFDVSLPIGETEIRVSASAIDTSNNIGPMVTLAIPITPNSAPLITLNNPTANNRVRGGETLDFEVLTTDDLELKEIRFSTFGAVNTSIIEPIPAGVDQFTANFNVIIPNHAKSGDSITVQAVALDSAGNTSALEIFTLYIEDNNAPLVTITNPVNNAQVVPGGTVDIVVTASDDVGLDSITLTTNPNLGGPFIRNVPSDSETFTIQIPNTLVAPAQIELIASATDTSGNVSVQASKTLQIADVGNSSPLVTISSPVSGAVLDPRNPLTVVVEASLTDPVERIDFSASGVLDHQESRVILPPTTPASGNFSLNFNPLPATGGLLTLDATAIDQTGISTSANRVTVSILDVVPPEIVSVSPPDSASDVNVDTSVVIQLSEAIDPATVTAATVTLSEGGSLVPVDVGVSNNNQLITLTPVSPLQVNTTYTVTATNGMTDGAANPLASIFTSAFTTESTDVIAPQVASILPNNNADEISPTTSIQVAFTEPIDSTTVDANSFSVRIGANPVDGSFAFNNMGDQVAFTANASFPLATEVEIHLASTITDMVGNPLADGNGDPLTQPLISRFTTGSFRITNPTDGGGIIENTAIFLEATASASLGVARVVFSVNGQDLTPVTSIPFTIPFTTPSAGMDITITATAFASNDTEIAQDQISVSTASGLLVTPNLVGFPVGQRTILSFILSSPLSSDLTIDLSAVNPTIVSFPVNPVVFPAGQTSVSAAVDGSSSGSTTILATSNLGIAGAIVSVSDPVPGQTITTLSPVLGVSVQPALPLGSVIIPENLQRTISLRVLSSPAPVDIPVAVTSSDPNVVGVVGNNVMVRGGEQVATVTLSTGQAGETTLILRVGTDIRQLTVVVGANGSAGIIPPILAAPVGIGIAEPPSVGPILSLDNRQHDLWVPLLSSPAVNDVNVSVSSSNPSIAEVLGTVSIQENEQVALVTLSTGVEGEAQLIFDLGTEVVAMTVVVGSSSPSNRVPPTLAPTVRVEVTP